MKLSFSNIAWPPERDEEVYEFLTGNGYNGIEIAPTRIYPHDPYEHIDEARGFAARLSTVHGMGISSMQSIWYGRTESIFGKTDERRLLVDYTCKAVDFAISLGCKNLVFGCPGNRNIPEGYDKTDAYKVARTFFDEIGNYAHMHAVVIALEPNPLLYATNFINSSCEAFSFAKGIEGVKVNIDCGTIIENGEDLRSIADNIGLVNHVHISEPNLEVIKKRSLHEKLWQLLADCGFNKYVSVEMKNFMDMDLVKQTAVYVREIFG